MRRLFSIAAVLLLFAVPSFASTRHRHCPTPETHMSTAIGFHDVDAPIGMRVGLTPKVSADFGIGVTSTDAGSDWVLDGGFPLTLKKWDGMRLLFRPGILYTDKCKATTLSAELEGEAFLKKNFSVSAAVGLANRNADGENTLATTGSKFTHVGFHLYLFR